MIEFFLNILLFLLVVLGILIIIVLSITTIILLSPLKYNFEGGNKEGKIFANGKFSWLFKSIIGDFYYHEDEEPVLKLRLFGKDVEEIIRKIQEIQWKKEKKQREKKEKERNKGNKDKANKDKSNKKENILVARENQEQQEQEDENSDLNISQNEEISTENNIEDNEVEIEIIIDTDNQEQTGYRRVKLSEVEELEELEAKKKRIKYTLDDLEWFSLIEKLKTICKKTVDFIKTNIKKIIDKITKGYKELKNAYLEFKSIRNKKIILNKAIKSIKSILREFLPRELNVSGVIGFDDPSTTGYFMGFIGALVGRYGEHIDIEGDFSKSNYENISVDGKGNIVFGKVIFAIGSFWFDPIFQNEFKNFFNKRRM